MKPLPFVFAITPTLLALSCSALADESSPSAASSPDAWERFNDWSIGDVLFPNLHIHGAGGFSSGDAGELASGGHDPRRESFSAQAIEPGVSLRASHIEGFANYLFYQDEAGDWDGELEEAFGKLVNLPGGFELKGGQYLSRFGAMNDKHLHAWDFVDSEMVLSRFLGEDGLRLQGAELSWLLPFGMDPGFVSIASLGFGNARAHQHEDGHHDGHVHDESPHEGENAALADDIWTARLMGRYHFNDFHAVTAGLSWAAGTNGFGRDTRVAGLDAEYLWRENGLEAGGRAFRLRGELLWREVDALTYHEDDDETFRGNDEEWGAYTHAIYTWHSRIDTGLRLGWVEGVDDFGQSERFRISPSVSWWFDDARRVGVRAQYNHDSVASRNDEHLLWLQLNISLGSGVEVR